MSVLIKGMEMPKTCSNCAVVQYDDEESEYYCPFSNKIAFRDSRRASCPFVELPEHGDLIDANEFAESLLAESNRVWNLLKPSTREMIQRVCDDIRNYPPVIPAERGMNE